MKKILLAFILSTVAGLACGSGGSDVPSTLGGMCNETGAAMCESATKCSSMTKSLCVSAFVFGCCEDKDKCGASIAIDATAYSKCKSDLARMSCADVDNSKIPSSCASM